MKVLLVNGSPHKEGCTYTALAEVGAALNQSGIGTDVFWIGYGLVDRRRREYRRDRYETRE